MLFQDYDEAAASTCKDTIKGNVSYFILGLCGETGEVAEHFKKSLRDGYVPDTTLVVKELGDCLWYLSMLAAAVGSSLEEVAQANIDKLASRKARDVIGGNGDER